MHALRYDTPTYVLFPTNYDDDDNGKDEYDYVPFSPPGLLVLYLPRPVCHSFTLFYRPSPAGIYCTLQVRGRSYQLMFYVLRSTNMSLSFILGCRGRRTGDCYLYLHWYSVVSVS